MLAELTSGGDAVRGLSGRPVVGALQALEEPADEKPFAVAA